MNITNIPFDLCRSYVLDSSDLLSEDSKNKILGYLRNRDLNRLSTVTEWLPDVQQSQELTRFAMQVAAFFKKNAQFTSLTARDAAIASFHRGEKLCRITNRRLDHYLTNPNRLSAERRCEVDRMKYYISNLLGDYRPFLESLPSLVRFTSGASAHSSRKNSLPNLKPDLRMRCTSRSVPYVIALGKTFGYDVRPRVSNVNRVEFVPKSWKTDRTIACEPVGNLPLQLAFDAYGKQRLYAHSGIDLSSQEKNKRLARRGSIDGTLATIDLSMASDTVSLNAVYGLFPYEWAKFLSDIRSPFYSIGRDSSIHKYAKFSSMGNGSTFVIETIIFSAACYAVGSREYSVYGDDIIIETELSHDLSALLAFFGFHINSEKSFTSGPFRESCGGNYFRGVDVTPVYIREKWQSNAIICANINLLRDVTLPEGHTWSLLKKVILTLKLPVVPVNPVLHSGIMIDMPTSYSKKLVRIRLRKHYGIPMFKGYSLINRVQVHSDSRSLFLWFLSKFHRNGERNNLILPSKVTRVSLSDRKFRKRWVRWTFPTGIRVDYLHWWSDFLTSS